MRVDQYEKLQALSEKLTDVFITEADPDHWPGASIDPKDMSQQTRGDRYWSKKNAVATLSLVSRVGMLTTMIQEQSNAGAGAAQVTDEADQLDAEINAAEKEANKLLDELTRRTKKAAFDKHVHGGNK